MKKIVVFALCLLGSLTIISSIAYAFSFQEKAENYLNWVCKRPRIDNINAVLCYFRDRISDLDTRVKTLETAEGRHILDAQQVRGANWETDSTVEMIPTPDFVILNCSRPCILFVNYDVDTRNTESSGNPIGYNHLYGIFIDGIDQAVFNQVSASVTHAAYPLAVNGGFSVSQGQHKVQIYARTTGGHLQQFESHLRHN